jgi:hypothetical protein
MISLGELQTQNYQTLVADNGAESGLSGNIIIKKIFSPLYIQK